MARMGCFYVTGENLEKILKEIFICARPQLPQRVSVY